MATKLRTITNAGQPLVDAHGDVLASTRITFTLVDYHGDQKDSFDATTHERIVSSDIYTTTNSSGIFSINLWPTSRGVDAVYYLCHVSHTGVKDFIAPLPDGETPLSWSVFKAGGAILTAADQSALALHIADEDVHGLVPIVNLTTSTTTTLDGILKGDAGALAEAVPSVDYLVPTDLDSFATVATTGSYNDLADVPTSLPPDTHTHVATDVTEDTTHRFATDAEKTTWNAKVGTTDARLSDARTPVAHVHAPSDVTEDTDNRFVTDAEIAAWNGKQDALGFTAVATTDPRLSDARDPLTHTQAATTITQDSTHRFVTDTEKSTWTAKQDALGFTPAIADHTHEDLGLDYTPEDAANKGVANGYCPLDADAFVPEYNLPIARFVVDEYATLVFNPSITGAVIFVMDASGDPALTTGWGYYLGDGTSWVLIYSEQYGPANVTVAASDITEDATHRFVTDTEKSTWSGKQDALGFTAENSANKGAANGYAPLDADQKVPTANLPTMSAGTVAWDDVTSKPTSFTPSSHASTHSTGQADAITAANIGAAAASHAHAATDVTEDSTHRFTTDTEKSTWNGKQDSLGFTAENSANKGAASGYAPLGADSKVPSANLPTLTTSFLGLTDTPAAFTGQAGKAVLVNTGETALEFGTAGSGNGVYVGTDAPATPEDGQLWWDTDDTSSDTPTVAWGSVTGTLTDQTDLGTALSGKAPTANPTLTGTLSHGIDAMPVFRARFGGATDTAWKVIGTFTQSAGAYRGSTVEVEIIQGWYYTTTLTDNTDERHRFVVTMIRSGAVDLDKDTALIKGSSTDLVRVVKTQADETESVYELQVRQPVNYRHMEVIAHVISNSSSTTNWVTSIANGSTTGTTYTPTCILNINGNYIRNGNLLVGTVTDQTGAKAGVIQLKEANNSGIYLGNTANSAASVLDWYEEGSWTPVMAGVTTAGTATYTTQTGKYTRIGNRVDFNMTVAWSGHDGTGAFKVTGLPFTSSVASAAPFSVYYGDLTVGAGKQLSPIMTTGGSTDIHLKVCDPAGGVAGSVAVDAACTNLSISGTYFVA